MLLFSNLSFIFHLDYRLDNYDMPHFFYFSFYIEVFHRFYFGVKDTFELPETSLIEGIYFISLVLDSSNAFCSIFIVSKAKDFSAYFRLIFSNL